MKRPSEPATIRGAALLVTAIALSACNRPVPTPVTEPEAAVRQTAAAITLEAQLTSIASGTQPTSSPATAAVTPGPAPTQTPAASPLSTTEAPASTATPEAGTCDLAEFVEDVSVPDGTQFQPGETFDKTWLIRNTGSCEWDSNYSVVFVDGDSMNGPAAVTLTSGLIAPGEELEVTVTLTAPFVPGVYRGNWKIRNPAGQVFGVGSDGSREFWVEIEVVGETTPTAEE